MLTRELIIALRDAVPTTLDAAARSKLDDWFLDAADAASDVEHPGLPFRLLGMIGTRIYEEIKAGEIAASRAARGLPRMATAAGDATSPLRRLAACQS